jgi:hypothetical protein
MPTNPFFNFTMANNEQTLVEDLITEAIQIYGHSAYYIPREDANLDRLFGEDPLASFNTAFEIELYIKSSTSFGGNGVLMSKFGITSEDQATFLVSMRRFNEVFAGRLARPREGDIIYISFFGPAWRYLFEVRYVNSTDQLFQLGKLYTYELKCETMNYSHERVQTSIPDINRIAEREAYTIDLLLTDPNGSGDFLTGETVYQGGSLLDATASGTVGKWDAVTKTLSVQNISGTFASQSAGPVIGVTSGTTRYFPNNATPVETAPQNLEPTTLGISDNELLTDESPTVVVPIHNPRYNQ